jgi:hypothetical protein
MSWAATPSTPHATASIGRAFFEGFSVDIADVATSWDLSGFYNQQTADGILDRQAIGTEARYFDDRRSLYALVDYDVSYSTLNNVYLVGNWRTAGQLTMNATVNRAHSPYLTTSNALMGSPSRASTSCSRWKRRIRSASSLSTGRRRARHTAWAYRVPSCRSCRSTST